MQNAEYLVTFTLPAEYFSTVAGQYFCSNPSGLARVEIGKDLLTRAIPILVFLFIP